MAEEQVVETPVEAPEAPSYSETELQAMSMGWKPKEQWEGPDDGWIEAKEYVGRKSLFDKIETLSRRVKEQERVLFDFKGHYDKVEETAYKRAIQELKQQKRAALEEEDTRQVLKIEDQIEELEDNYDQYKQNRAQNVAAQPGPSPEFVTWVQSNDWYAKDRELNKVADGLGMAYLEGRPGSTQMEVLEYVSKEVRKRFPEKFQNPARAKPSAVDAGSARSGGKPSSQEGQLPQEARDTMNRFIRAGVMTKEQYLKDYYNK